MNTGISLDPDVPHMMQACFAIAPILVNIQQLRGQA